MFPRGSASMAHSSNEARMVVASATAGVAENVDAEMQAEPFNSVFMIHKKGCDLVSVQRGGETFVFEGHVLEEGQTVGVAFSLQAARDLSRHAVFA